jgi:hypothetical protein
VSLVSCVVEEAVGRVIEGARQARSWNELWRVLVLASDGWWRGFAATSENGSLLFESGEKPHGEAVTLSAGRVTIAVALDDPETLSGEARVAITHEINTAAERLLHMPLTEIPGVWAEAMLTAVMERSHDRVAFFSRDKRYVRVNAGLAGWHGVVEAHHVGASVREVLGDFAGPVETVVDEVFSTAEARHAVYYTGALPGRPTQTLVGSYFPIVIDGEVQLCGAVVHEVNNSSWNAVAAVQDAVAHARAHGHDVAGIERALLRVGIGGDTCDAHDVALATAARLHTAGETADVLRWDLFAGDARVAVSAKLAEAVITEGLLLAGRGRTCLIRTMLRRDHLVFVIEGPVGVSVKMHTSEELEQHGGSTQVDGAITIRLPLLAAQQRVADESGTPTV